MSTVFQAAEVDWTSRSQTRMGSGAERKWLDKKPVLQTRLEFKRFFMLVAFLMHEAGNTDSLLHRAGPQPQWAYGGGRGGGRAPGQILRSRDT